jgi:hypothetical protein
LALNLQTHGKQKRARWVPRFTYVFCCQLYLDWSIDHAWCEDREKKVGELRGHMGPVWDTFWLHLSENPILTQKKK